MKWIYLTLLVLVSVLGFCSGIGWEQSKVQAAEPSTVEEAILFLEEARASHQVYVDNPEWCRWYLGDWNHHKRWTERYSSIITLLEEESLRYEMIPNELWYVNAKKWFKQKVLNLEFWGLVLEYQGQYKDVKGGILRDAPPDALFTHWFGYSDEPETVYREEW